MKKNKKLTINTLALGNLKQRKKQYTIMIIGIILAMVFSSSILFLATAFYDSTTELKYERFGKENIIWENVTEDEIQQAKKQKMIGKSGYAHIIGSISSANEDFYDSSVVAWLDDNAIELANPVLSEGSLPTNQNEIAIEALMLSKMGIDAQVGDTITVNFEVQNNSTSNKYVQKEYKLVGILKNKVNYISFTTAIDEGYLPSAIVCQNTVVDLGGKESLVCYASFYNGLASKITYEKFDKYFNSMGYEYDGEHCAIISSSNVFYTNDNVASDMSESIIFCMVIIAVLMLTACLSIINAFSSNLKTRKKQIGLLRTVGSTRRQIINIFGREALIICLIATPISCVISFVVVKLIVSLLGDGYFLKLHLWAILLSVAFSVLCVMLSALIPLYSATKISPMQAIRNIDDLHKMKEKGIKSKKEFDVSKLISSRNMVFRKGKQATVSLILIVAIVSSGYAFSWYSYAKDDIRGIESDYELTLASSTISDGVIYKTYKNGYNNGYSESDRQAIMSNQYVSASSGIKYATINLLTQYSNSDYRKLFANYDMDYNNYSADEITSENYESSYFYDNVTNKDTEKMQQLLQCSEFISAGYQAIDESDLEALSSYVYDGEINIDKINSGEEIVLSAPKQSTLFYDDGKYGGLGIS